MSAQGSLFDAAPRDLRLVGYTHASIVRILCPDRGRASDAYTHITRRLCDCPDFHVAVYVAPVEPVPPRIRSGMFVDAERWDPPLIETEEN